MTSQCSSSVGGAGAGGGSTAASTWGSGIGGEEDEEEDAVDREVLEKALDAVRYRVKHYRMYIKPSFQASELFSEQETMILDACYEYRGRLVLR